MLKHLPGLLCQRKQKRVKYEAQHRNSDPLDENSKRRRPSTEPRQTSFSSGAPELRRTFLICSAIIRSERLACGRTPTPPSHDGWPVRGTHLGHVLSGLDRIALMKSRQLVNPARCCGGREERKKGGRRKREKKTSRLIQRRMRHHPRKGQSGKKAGREGSGGKISGK